MEVEKRRVGGSLFITILILIVVSDDTLWFGTNGNSSFESIKYGVLLITLGLLFLFNMRTIDLSRVQMSALVCVAMCALVLLTGVLNSDLRTGYFYKCCILMLGFLFARNFSFEAFAETFEKIMFFFAVTSVFFTILATINKALVASFPVFYNSAGTAFYNMLVCMITVSGETVRNYGIFREPGVFQMFLMVGLLFYTYFGKEFKIYRFFIYIVAVGLTYSTTGYIALMIYLILYLVKDNRKLAEKKKKIAVVVLIIVGLLLLLLTTDLLSSDGIVFDKFSNMKRHTTIARFASISANIEMWLQSPIFGKGLIYVSDTFPEISLMRYGYASTHNTNTLFCELATYGILYTVIFVVGYIRLVKIISKRKIEQCLIGAVLLVLVFGEKLTFSPIVYILMFYGLSNRDCVYERIVDRV